MTTAQIARRKLNPHAEARLASILWPREFNAKARVAMDLWDALDEKRKRYCIDQVELIQTTKSVVPT